MIEKTSLVDLQAKFITITGIGNVSMADAQGMDLLCPKCFNEPPRGPIMVHHVVCWFRSRKVPTGVPPEGRWNIEGKGIEDLSFVRPGNVSVELYGGCDAHFFIRDGHAIDFEAKDQ